MGIRCGIVGLPNVGKSTLFNALTAAEIDAANYPFCTIDPNVGIATVPDPRLDDIAAISKPKEIVPTVVEFVDIAGLVSGASHGEGLGNQFLSHIRETDAIAQVVRCFEDTNVVHVSGEIDPIADIDIINTELAAGRPVRSLGLDDERRLEVRDLFLLTAKPAMYIANVSEDGLHDNPLVDAVRTHAEEDGADLVVISGSLEAELALVDAADHDDLLSEYGLDEPGLHKVIRAAYHLLGLLTFFTTGDKESRAWTVRRGATAQKAAGQIHTDFERGFIRAEVVPCTDFVGYGGELGAKDAGKWRLEGKDYVVQEGDVIYFRFNV